MEYTLIANGTCGAGQFRHDFSWHDDDGAVRYAERVVETWAAAPVIGWYLYKGTEELVAQFHVATSVRVKR